MSTPLTAHRCHVPPLSSHPLFPEGLREHVTFLLRKLWTLELPISVPSVYTPPTEHLVPTLKSTLRKIGGSRIVQLCAGGTGMARIAETLLREAESPSLGKLEILLTDPNPTSPPIQLPPSLTYISTPILPTCVPPSLTPPPAQPDESLLPSTPTTPKRGPKKVINTTMGRRAGKQVAQHVAEVQRATSALRLMVGEFHQFSNEECKSILEDAVKNGHAICIFDSPPPTLFNLSFQLTLLPLIMCYLSLRYPTPGRLFFTFCTPVIPCVAVLDSVAASLSSRSEKELKAVVEGVSGKDKYMWKVETGSILGGFWEVMWIVGTPRA
ncbi:uncharacterized protein SPPG_06226 [Spizellomyces punctatus DAOM BR117]|uniref:Uncharacterized protein n=1 Tax=Spizellomyces punctatus (strain DAOM BR117) TaxID=645134 RepID=A0A0L0HCB8_SPIPD|nr:uncharacterized protein SPPG_06226 [Spizellomyces punctatus DAOM BR117]KNC98534.1 hypothetical protein SPPG_06226 [Spizellomyces punctatus DAOM BR117]|eukprot:XP_016606574.1 hypothetical protein SPPG_06226 [Spizellomyces punctatus DAOM BR117]